MMPLRWTPFVLCLLVVLVSAFEADPSMRRIEIGIAGLMFVVGLLALKYDDTE
jgi:hypothetical protein